MHFVRNVISNVRQNTSLIRIAFGTEKRYNVRGKQLHLTIYEYMEAIVNLGKDVQKNREEVYAPVEPMSGSSTAFMMREFISRAVFSDGTKDYREPAEPKAGDTVKIRIRVARGNVFAVVLIWGENRIQMERESYNELFEVHVGEIKLGTENIDYYFLIWSGTRYYFYNQVGVSEEHDPNYDFRIMPGFTTPDWAKGAVIYQIFTDRFADGNGGNEVINGEYSYIDRQVEKVHDWNALPMADDIRRFYGGDLNGVLKKLDYLQELGVEVIYFNPLFVSPSNHKYDTQDYDYIDPHLTVIPYDYGETLPEGSTDNTKASRYINRITDKRNLEASNRFFADFVDEVHRRGMKIILDGVFNHCGSFNKWLDKEKIYNEDKGYEKGAFRAADSPYRTFFRFLSEQWPDNEDYDGWWGHKTLPKLNYEESKELEEYILKIAAKWVSAPYNVDGWRLDVAADLGFSEEYNHRFWQKFRDTVKKANPNALILAENYSESGKWLQGKEWDSIMNYEAFMEPVSWFLTGMEKHSDYRRDELYNNYEAFFGAMIYNMTRMNVQSLQTAMNELSNHDHSRFLTRTNGKAGRLATAGSEAASEGVNTAVMREAVMIQMTWPGAPTVYYGDEAGLCGWTDPDDRRTYPWGHEDKELIGFHKAMIEIHRSYDALKTGSFRILFGRKGIISFGRFDSRDKFAVVINNNDYHEEVDIPIWEMGCGYNAAMVKMMETREEGYSPAASIYREVQGCIHLSLGPHSGVVLKNLPEGMA